VDRRRRRGGAGPRDLPHLHRGQPACRRRSTCSPPTATPTSSCSSPRAAARPTSRSCTRRRGRS
jgi:hypothetical protein